MSCDLFKLQPPAVGPLNLRTICSLNIKRERGRGAASSNVLRILNGNSEIGSNALIVCRIFVLS